MFTGIIQTIGEVKGVRQERESARLEIRAGAGFEDLALGESVAVDGACLTVDQAARGCFHAFASPETLGRTTLGSLKPGSEVNLERALRPADRLGGHFVLGHVDCTGTILARLRRGEALLVRVEAPAEILPMVVPKGSIAVDGVSLTVNEVTTSAFSVMIVPFTASETTLARKEVGTRVNLETDILAKHILRIVAGILPGMAGAVGAGGGARSGAAEGKIDLDFLAEHGFLK